MPDGDAARTPAGHRQLELDAHGAQDARAIPRLARRVTGGALVLTVRYEWLGLEAGDLILDLGCGAGRHAFEAFRRGARVVALDYSAAELKDVKAMFGALLEEESSTLPASTWGGCANGDATRLPFPDS